MPIIQPDPRYFDIGNSMLATTQQGRENKRQNALLDMNQQRFGAEQEAGRREKAMQAMSGFLAAAAQSASPSEFVRGHIQPFSQGLQELGIPLDPSTLDDNQVRGLAEKFGSYKPQTTWKEATRVIDGKTVYGQENSLGEFKRIDPYSEGGGDRSPYYEDVYSEEGAWSFNARTGEYELVKPGFRPILQDPNVQGPLAASREGGKVTGGAVAEERLSLPKLSSQTRRQVDEVRALLSHAGFRSTVGATLKPGARFVDGTKEADFMSRLDQVTGGAFLGAYETLKGGGQITEVEGKKATDAINRMKKSVSEEEFIRAAGEYIDVLETGLQRAIERAETPVQGIPGSPGGGDKYVVGQEYEDANGNRATYLGNGKWSE